MCSLRALRSLGASVLIGALLSSTMDACTIFVQSTSHRVLIGNNEDNSPDTPTHLWFHAPRHGEHGYVLWGGDLVQPEGGMNDRGVFFDAAALPHKLPLKRKAGLSDLNSYAVVPVLSRAASVQEALNLLSRFNLVEQEKAQIFLADASGDYAVVHANYVLRKKAGESTFVLTNYALQDDPEVNQVCWRRRTVQQEIQTKPVSLKTISKALQDSAQRDPGNATLYSEAVDLKRRQILLYVRQDFAHPVSLSLKRELGKGDHDLAMESLVPTPLTTAIQHKGASAVLQDQALLGQNTARQFRDAAYALANHGDPSTGLRFLDEENRRFGDSDQTHGDRGVLFMASRQNAEAKREFSQALTLRPEDHQANLFANKDGIVRFRLRAFPHAEHVAIAGSFNHYSKNALRLQRRGEEWVGEVHLAPGAYAYQVFVDGNWQMDPENGLLTKPAQWWISSLLVQD